VLGLTLLCPLILRAGQFYVAPTGSPSNDGSIAKPWDLQTALEQPTGVQPGDIIWLRGGIYRGTFTSWLQGAPSSPIVVREYPGERATLDGGNSSGTAILTINGSDAWYWGFEVTSSDPNRSSSQSGSSPTDIGRGDGIDGGTASGIRLIDLIIHDTRQGISAFSETSNLEINGCLIYYNGWWSTPEGNGNGHGIYTQNQAPATKRYLSNLVFENFGLNIQAYGSSSASLDNFDFEGNTIFEAGQIVGTPHQDILIGGGRVANNPKVIANLLYEPPSGTAAAFELGYSFGSGTAHAVVRDNYVAAGALFWQPSDLVLKDNVFTANTTNLSQGSFPDNIYFNGSRPSGAHVFIRPSPYEPGRAIITVYNWDDSAEVAVDLSSVIGVGSAYEIRNAQDYFGAPVASGTYAGTEILLPMTGLSVVAPVGWPAPAMIGPDFNAFVLSTSHFVGPTLRALPSRDKGKPVMVGRP
jgi:hypothetical protein